MPATKARPVAIPRPSARDWYAHLTADDDTLSRAERLRLRAQMSVLVPALRLNDWLIRRFRPDLPVRWSSDDLAWADGVTAAFPDIRGEVDRYLGRGVRMPQVAEVAGLDPASERAQREVPATQGAWRTLVLFVNGTWVPETTAAFPATRAATEGVPGLTSVAFTGLEGGSHIDRHAAPNRGGLRYQLPIIVPGRPGECRIQIVDEVVAWAEGEPVMFDFAEPHEVWNDTAELRILLMLEVRTPLPAPLSWINRAVQRLYAIHPSYQGMERRVADFERRQQAGAA